MSGRHKSHLPLSLLLAMEGDSREPVVSVSKVTTLSGDSLSSAVLSGDIERVNRMLSAGVGVDSMDSVR